MMKSMRFNSVREGLSNKCMHCHTLKSIDIPSVHNLKLEFSKFVPKTQE